jgi:hypothetical protein
MYSSFSEIVEIKDGMKRISSRRIRTLLYRLTTTSRKPLEPTEHLVENGTNG